MATDVSVGKRIRRAIIYGDSKMGVMTFGLCKHIADSPTAYVDHVDTALRRGAFVAGLLRWGNTYVR